MAQLEQNKISKEEVNKLFFYENGVLFNKTDRANRKIKAGEPAGCLNNKGYYHTSVKGKRFKNHRLIWIMFNGNIDTNMQIDHINGIRDDNRIENLRVVTNKENSRNRNFAKGCSYDKDKSKWRAVIRIDGKSKHLGYFDTESEATKKYKEHKGYLMGCDSDTIRDGGFGSTGYKR